jgi:hypothetical protein
MLSSLKIKRDETTGENYIDFADLEHLFDDPDAIDSYDLSWDEDGTGILQFFDKDGNTIKAREK